MAEYGVTNNSLKEVLEEESNASNKVLSGVEVELTPRSKELLATAKQVAMQLNHNFVGTEHLLFSILISSGTYAVKVLTNFFKINLTEVKSKVLISLQTANDDQILDDTKRSSLPDKLLEMGCDITL